MRANNVFEVLLSPHVTEKTSASGHAYRQFVFKVAKTSTKHQIKKAVEELFNVVVRSVRTLNVNGKSVRFGKTMGKHSAWKKAYVTLAEGQDIDLSDKH